MSDFIEILDPEQDGYVTYPHFLEICALKINSKSEESKHEEVEAAYKLFTKGGDRPIALHDLRNVATTLKENVGDDVLKVRFVLDAR